MSIIIMFDPRTPSLLSCTDFEVRVSSKYCIDSQSNIVILSAPSSLNDFQHLGPSRY